MIDMDKTVVVGNAPEADLVKVVVVGGYVHLAAAEANKDFTVWSGGTAGLGFTGYPMSGIEDGKLMDYLGRAVILGNAPKGFSHAIFENGSWSQLTPWAPVGFDSYTLNDNGVNGAVFTGNSGGRCIVRSESDGKLYPDTTVASEIKGIGSQTAFTAGSMDRKCNIMVAYVDNSAIYGGCALAEKGKFGKVIKLCDLPGNVSKITFLSTDFDVNSNPTVHMVVENSATEATEPTVTLFRVNGDLARDLTFSEPAQMTVNGIAGSFSFHMDNSGDGHFGYIDPRGSAMYTRSTPTGWTLPTTVVNTSVIATDITGNAGGDLVVAGIDKDRGALNIATKLAGEEWTHEQVVLNQRLKAFDLALDDARTLTVGTLDGNGKVSVAQGTVS